jgi:hypothetical protein
MGRILLALVVAASALSAAEWTASFDEGTEGWILPLPKDWALIDSGGGKALRLAKDGPIGSPRRPVKFALYEPACVADFELEVKVRRREKSLIVVFGYQDRSHFYYAHISSDDGSHSVHNGLFKVYGGSRYRFAGFGSAPALPDTDWHRIRIVRAVAAGTIAVFVDDDSEPRFEAIDPSFRFGRVGLGSFNETGDFDDFRLRGETSEACPSDDLSPLDPS